MDTAGQECELDVLGDFHQLTIGLPNLATAGVPEGQVSKQCAAVLEPFEPEAHRASIRDELKEAISDKLSGDPPVQVPVALQLVGTEPVRRLIASERADEAAPPLRGGWKPVPQHECLCFVH